MTVTFKKLHPHIGAEASPLDLRQVHDRTTLDALVAGMDEHGVLVFRDHRHRRRATRVRGALRRAVHTKPGIAAVAKNRSKTTRSRTSRTSTRAAASAPPRPQAAYRSRTLWHTTRHSRIRPAATRAVGARAAAVGADTSSPNEGRYTRSTPRPKAIEGLNVHHSIATLATARLRISAAELRG